MLRCPNHLVKPREAAIAGTSLLPCIEPPVRIEFVVDGECIGYMNRYKNKGHMTAALLFPRHFLDFSKNAASIELHLCKPDVPVEIFNYDASKVTVSKSYDLALYDDELLENKLKAIPIVDIAPEHQLHIQVERNGRWFHSVSKNPFRSIVQTMDAEQKYDASTQPGDCGTPVYCNGGCVGMHVGTYGGASQKNAFLYFGPDVRAVS